MEGYEFLEAFLQGHDYIVGNELTIADFSAVANVTTLNILVPIDAERFPNITAWVRRLEMLPYYNQSQVKGLADFRRAFEKIGK